MPKPKPVLLIVDPDKERAIKYAAQLEDKYTIKMAPFSDQIEPLLSLEPEVAIVNGYAGRGLTAEETIDRIRTLSPSTHILAVMKARKNPLTNESGVERYRDRIFEELMAAGADHVVSIFDPGFSGDYPGIVKAVEIAAQGRDAPMDIRANTELRSLMLQLMKQSQLKQKRKG